MEFTMKHNVARKRNTAMQKKGNYHYTSSTILHHYNNIKRLSVFVTNLSFIYTTDVCDLMHKKQYENKRLQHEENKCLQHEENKRLQHEKNNAEEQTC